MSAWVFAIGGLVAWWVGDAATLVSQALVVSVYLLVRRRGASFRPSTTLVASLAAQWAIVSAGNAVRGYPNHLFTDDILDAGWIGLHFAVLTATARTLLRRSEPQVGPDRAKRARRWSLVSLTVGLLCLDTPLIGLPTTVVRQVIGRSALGPRLCSVEDARYVSKVRDGRVYIVTQSGAAYLSIGQPDAPTYAYFTSGGSMQTQSPNLPRWLVAALAAQTRAACPPSR